MNGAKRDRVRGGFDVGVPPAAQRLNRRCLGAATQAAVPSAKRIPASHGIGDMPHGAFVEYETRDLCLHFEQRVNVSELRGQSLSFGGRNFPDEKSVAVLNESLLGSALRTFGSVFRTDDFRHDA
jgi:hypothetical protein